MELSVLFLWTNYMTGTLNHRDLCTGTGAVATLLFDHKTTLEVNFFQACTFGQTVIFVF